MKPVSKIGGLEIWVCRAGTQLNVAEQTKTVQEGNPVLSGNDLYCTKTDMERLRESVILEDAACALGDRFAGRP